MIKRKLYLHIGTEKTGTSSIQELLFQNKEVLSTQGYHVLQSAGKRNHRKLPVLLMKEEKYDDFCIENKINSNEKKKEYLKFFLNEINELTTDIHSVIITSEHFHSRINSLEEVQNVARFFEQYFNEIKVICYIREQAATCISLYSTSLKFGSTQTFDEMIECCTPDNIYYNYLLMLNNWCSVFGFKNIIVQIFDKNKYINNSLLDDFIFQIDSKLLTHIEKDIPIQNEGLNCLGQLLLLGINKVASGLNDKSIRQKVIDQKAFSGKGFYGTEEQHEKIYQSFQDSNRELNTKYFGIDALLFPYIPPKPNIMQLDLSYLDCVTKILQNVKELEQPHKCLDDKYADLFRDTAISLENKNLMNAFLYMELAHRVRPGGPAISLKLSQYKEKLRVSQNSP